MTLIQIDDPGDPRLDRFLRLTDMKLRAAREPDEGIFIAEGRLVIDRALKAGLEPLAAVATSKWAVSAQAELPAPVPIYELAESDLRELTGFRVHRGALVAFRRPAQLAVSSLLSSARRVVVLEDLVDHTNVGTIARSAAGLGFDGMIVSPSCADPLYRRSVKTSMGAVLSLPWSRATDWPGDIAAAREIGFSVVALSPTGDVPLSALCFTPSDRVALVLGTEGAGLSSAVQTLATHVVSIPMDGGVDSLNVAVAAGIACYALRQQLSEAN